MTNFIKKNVYFQCFPGRPSLGQVLNNLHAKLPLTRTNIFRSEYLYNVQRSQVSSYSELFPSAHSQKHKSKAWFTWVVSAAKVGFQFRVITKKSRVFFLVKFASMNDLSCVTEAVN